MWKIALAWNEQKNRNDANRFVAYLLWKKFVVRFSSNSTFFSLFYSWQKPKKKDAQWKKIQSTQKELLKDVTKEIQKRTQMKNHFIQLKFICKNMIAIWKKMFSIRRKTKKMRFQHFIAATTTMYFNGANAKIACTKFMDPGDSLHRKDTWKIWAE